MKKSEQSEIYILCQGCNNQILKREHKFHTIVCKYTKNNNNDAAPSPKKKKIKPYVQKKSKSPMNQPQQKQFSQNLIQRTTSIIQNFDKCDFCKQGIQNLDLHLEQCEEKIKYDKIYFKLQDGKDTKVYLKYYEIFMKQQKSDKIWKIELKGLKVVIKCGKIANGIEEYSDNQIIEKNLDSIGQLVSYVQNKVNIKFEKQYILQPQKYSFLKEQQQQQQKSLSQNQYNAKMEYKEEKDNSDLQYQDEDEMETQQILQKQSKIINKKGSKIQDSIIIIDSDSEQEQTQQIKPKENVFRPKKIAKKSVMSSSKNKQIQPSYTSNFNSSSNNNAENINTQNYQQQLKIKLFLCLLCFIEKNENTKITLACKICDHSFCEQCLQKYIEDQINSDNTCICQYCKAIISIDVIKIFLPDYSFDNEIQRGSMLDLNKEFSNQIAIQENLEKSKQFDIAMEVCNGDVEQASQLICEENFFELGGFNQLNQIQKNAFKYVAKIAKMNSEKIQSRLIDRAQRLGFTQEVVIESLKYIRDKAPITINFKLVNLKFFIKDGKYKNIFELGKSFELEPSRKIWESNIFNGLYDHSLARDKVKYGALNIFNDPCGIRSCQGYGTSFFILKDVRCRSTFYGKDTSYFQNDFLATCQHYMHILYQYNDEELKQVINIGIGKEVYYSQKDQAAGTYKEVQIHGEIVFSKHVQCMMYDPNDRHLNKKEIKLFAEKYNIQCFPIEKQKFQ